MKLNSILVFLFVIFLNNNSYTQNIQRADSLYSKGLYTLAAYEYEKEFFNATNDSVKNSLLLKKAYCYKNNGDFKNCYINLNRINPITNNDTLLFTYLYEKAFCQYMMNNYQGAENELLQLDHAIKDTTLTNNSMLLHTLTLIELGRYKESETCFTKMVDFYNIRNKADTALQAYHNLKFKSERKAKILSMIFPGLGQFYAKKPLHGISSIVLEGAAVTYLVSSVITGYYVTAIFTGAGMSFRFYTGGQKNSVNLVKQYNQRKKEEIKRKIMEFSQKNVLD